MNTRVPPGVVRVIAGRLRGSKLPVADHPGLRPTSDRVRETVFNWLQGVVAGSQVLDLFAGTGALGFEAASRGAATVCLVERDPALVASLRASAGRLKVPEVRVDGAEALAWLARPVDQKYDLVFVDPPFGAGLWQSAAAALAPWLAAEAWIYVETPLATVFAPPSGWRLHRQGQTREVRYTLFQVESGQPPVCAATLGEESAP